MWILHFLPDAMIIWAVNIVCLIGVLATAVSFFFVRFIPLMTPYKLFAQIISVLILTAGVYFKGGYETEMAWRERVTELENKISQAREESKAVNTVVETKVVTRTKIIKEKADTIVQYVDRPVIQEFDQKCPIPQEAIDVHNEAARMNKAIEELRKGKK